MPNIATLFREEIVRQSRKEVRRATENLKKASSDYRSSHADLKRRVTSLEQQVARLEKLLAKTERPATSSVPPKQVRFSATGLKKLRVRLEISAPVLASILGNSPQTIYNWEAGTTRPSAEQVANIAILRGMSKQEVHARLNQSGKPNAT